MISIKKLLLGQPLSTDRVSFEKLSKRKALAVFSSDAISSVAYATEEILLVLSFGVIAVNAFSWSWTIALAISSLLFIVVSSYRQIVKAYPTGGGGYTVCKENFGDKVSLLAGSALITDYTLTVAVSVAAGTAAVTSAFPALFEHRIGIATAAILVLMLINLRGIRESATIFAVPTYIFVLSMFVLFIWLGIKGIVEPVEATGSVVPSTLEGVGLWLVLRAFSSGCAALTGVEAISNGVKAFKKPEATNARRTLATMACILAALFLGITYFTNVYHLVPKVEETLVSQLARQTGFPPFYYFIQVATAAILFLAANTSFNGFPMLASIMADDRYLPRQLASRGDRLVYSNGIIILGLASIGLVWLFDANVHHLIPMYAIGVFLDFTLSQGGMIRHWLKNRGHQWKKSMTINAIGCVTTFVVLLIILFTKFTTGGWLICLVLPIMAYTFRKIRYHYVIVGSQLRLVGPPAPVPDVPPHHVIVPVSGIHRGVLEALNYGRSISKDITACYIGINDRQTNRIKEDWTRYGMGIKLKVLASPYRSVIRPLLDYIESERQLFPHAIITVIIPEFVTARWWHKVLHNQTAMVIKGALLFKRNVVVTNVRYHLHK